MSKRKKYFVEFKKWNGLYKKDDDTIASKADLLEIQARIVKLGSENDILKKALTIFAKK